MLQIGSLLDNKYKILSEVGHGGMSVVYLAINERANKTWAVKEVRKEGVENLETVMQGLIVETDMLKKLDHPNLPSIIDVIDTQDSFLIVMDYIEGSSLQKLLKTQGAQPEAKVIRWAKQLCDVLGYLHRQNPPIIYRDMKPANVMLKPDGNVTLIDFGTAREFKNRAMVEDTTCLGTRGYAAPEQFGGRGQTDARTDIYCLGATLYHLITGHSPAEPPYEIKPLSYWIPQYAGSGLEKLILKCTAQDPSERYQNCEELMYALNHYKEEDDRKQKIRKKKWKLFLAGCIVGIVGIAGLVGSRIAWSAEETASYDGLLSQAEKTEVSLDEAKSLYLEALKYKPTDSEAYESLLDKVEENIIAQGKLTDSVGTEVLGYILNSTGGGTTPYIDQLAKNNKREYAMVNYQVGLWYFFMKDNTGNNQIQAYSSYLSKITDETYKEYLGDTQWNLACILSNIGECLDGLNKSNKGTSDYSRDSSSQVNEAGETEISYSSLFNSLEETVNTDLKSSLKKDLYVMNIYKQVAFMLNFYHTEFVSDGVSDESIENVLDIMENGLNSLTDKDSDAYKDAQNEIDQVRNLNKQKGE